MVPLGLMFLIVLGKGDASTREAITTAVAGIVTLVPEGLILLVSVTYAAAALQLSRRGALAQQLNAIESLASVDLICLDKTGTLTEPGLRVVALEAADGVPPERLRHELSRFAASSPSKNATLLALAGDAVGEDAEEAVPFSSARRSRSWPQPASSAASHRRARRPSSRGFVSTGAMWRWSATASTMCPRSRPPAWRLPREAAPRWRAASPTSCS
jgi:hypothetical protein